MFINVEIEKYHELQCKLGQHSSLDDLLSDTLEDDIAISKVIEYTRTLVHA